MTLPHCSFCGATDNLTQITTPQAERYTLCPACRRTITEATPPASDPRVAPPVRNFLKRPPRGDGKPL